jgi:DNA-binding MarR family transcriptional regulator
MPKPIDPFALIRDFMLGLVRWDGPDMTARQLSIFLVIYREDAMHTVRGLADRLKVHRADVTRSADRLEEFGLLKRERDPRDSRSILLARTAAGMAHLSFMSDLIQAHRVARPQPWPREMLAPDG